MAFSTRRWLRDPGTLLAVGLTAYVAMYTMGVAITGPTDADIKTIHLAAFLPLDAGIVALAWIAAARIPREGNVGLRRALELTGVAFVAVLAGAIARFIYAHWFAGDPQNGWVNLPHLLLYPCWLVALLALPRAQRAQAERRKFLYDASTTLLGVGIAVWHLVLIPTMDAEPRTGFGHLVSVADAAGSIALVLGLTTAWLQLPRRHRKRFVVLLLGIALYAGSALASLLVKVHTGQMAAPWMSLVFMGPYVLLVWACQRYASHPPEPTREGSSLGRGRVQPFSPLPYVALAACYALLVAEAVRHPNEHWTSLAEGTLLVTLLIVLRQLAAVRENARLVAETTALENEARFRALVQHSSDVIAIADGEGCLRFVSPSVTRWFGYEPQELEGAQLMSLLHPDDVARGAAALSAATPPGASTAPTEWRIQHRDGRWLSVEAVGTNLLFEPTVRGIVLNARDVSERKALEAQLTHQAFHDPLTGLANRALFFDRVTHALERGLRHGDGMAVLFLDLDNFKTINDSLGHVAGDRLLVAAAVRLAASVRTSDTVARLGGDEFAVLIEDANAELAGLAADRITAALREPFAVEGKEVVVTASLGIAVATPGMTASELLRNADMAMYTAKSRGKARSEQFETRMHREALDRLELEADLRHALERAEFTLLYQPIVSLEAGQIVGMEALIRWKHPRRGLLYPSQFIPLAEETGLIVPLGEWVVTEGCRQAAEWDVRWRLATPLNFAVNVSGQQLHDPSIVGVVQRALTESGLRPSSLVLEITESVLMQRTETMLERLTQLKAVGVRLAIDDFGTGYSSLSYLQRFPIDILKIAKSFVDDVGRERSQPVLARAIIALAETLGLRTVAEGIEVQEQWQALRGLGCELGQGYFFARPMSAAAMEQKMVSGWATHGVVPTRKG
jgi:diguanylate cyclase (GGDEF)-like protein/PAS domain S-box-containing protein